MDALILLNIFILYTLFMVAGAVFRLAYCIRVIYLTGGTLVSRQTMCSCKDYALTIFIFSEHWFIIIMSGNAIYRKFWEIICHLLVIYLYK